MEPIPYFYDHVNRSAIGIIPRQPLLDWINAIYPESPVNAIEDGSTYLVPIKNDTKELTTWLKKNFDEIFQNELNNWHIDQADWPSSRTYTLFSKWFEIAIYPMVLDLEESPLKKR